MWYILNSLKPSFTRESCRRQYGKGHITPFQRSQSGGKVGGEEYPTHHLNMTYNFFFSGQQNSVCTMSEADPANPYQNQIQINWLNWASKPPGARPKKAPPLYKQLISSALQKAKPS